MTTDGLDTLTEREKETLRLLLVGHDAKSAALTLGLSVHTVNERLRDARRKLNASSSREAARLLAAHERADPQFLMDKRLGVATNPDEARHDTQPDVAPARSDRLIWLGGGMLIMSLIIAAGMFLMISGGARPIEEGGAPPPAAASSSQAASLAPAQRWLSLLDRQRWDESWRTASAVFRSQVPETQWSSTMQAVRRPLGAVAKRTFQNVTQTATLPGLPTGSYEVIQFATDFARKKGAVETIVLAREGGGWTVSGYFIR